MEETTISIPSSIWTSLNGWFTSTVFFILLNLMIATIVFTSNLPTNNNNQQLEEEQDDHRQQKQKQDSNSNQQNQPQVTRSPSILNRIKSFNFSQIAQPGSDPETHYQENPLEVAATQFVFNQPLHYQHFDFDPVNPGEEMETGRTRFEFDPTRQETETNRFDYDLVSLGQETERGLTHFDFETTHEEKEMTHLSFDPDHEVTRQDSGFEEETDEFESLDDVYSRLKGGGGHVDRTKSEGEITTRVPAKPAAAKMRKSASMKVGFSNIESDEKVESRRPKTSRQAAAVAAMDEDDEDDVEVDAKADDFINKFKNDLKLQRIESIMKKNVGKK